VLSPVGDHILQESNTLCLTRFKTYKIARPAQTRGWGQINTCRKVPLQLNFLDDTTLCFGIYLVN
jgi:hypothetical protein